jgi:hypothetical protein
MDEIKTRLRESADACYARYEGWVGNKRDGAAREALQEAIHELRKVASRLEIELAVSERDEMALKPIPIPPHRDAQRRPRSGEERDAFGNDEDGNEFRAPRENGGRDNRSHNNLRRRMGMRRDEGQQGGNHNNNAPPSSPPSQGDQG